MAPVEEIAKKIIEDDEYRDFLINGVIQRNKTEGKVYFVSRESYNFAIVKKGSEIAHSFGEKYKFLKASATGLVVYGELNEDGNIKNKRNYATIHHEDYKCYSKNIKDVTSFSLENYNCAFINNCFVASKDSVSSFNIINPSFRTNIDEIILSAEKITNKTNQHTGNIKIALRFSKQNQNIKELSGTKLIEFDLGKNLKPSSAISDICESGKIQNDPDSGIYEVFFEVYELIVDGSWKLQSSKKIKDNFEWKSKKQYIAERLIEDEFYIENTTDDEISFYSENRESIEIIKNKIAQKISEDNIKKVNESAAEREQENNKQDAMNNLKGLIDSLGNYIDTFDMALESGSLNDMDILRQLRTIDETLSSILDLKDNINDKSKVIRNKKYISSIYERYKNSEKANKSACLRMETLISLFDEL